MDQGVLTVAYLRVSTEKQEVEAQRRAVEDFAKRRGFTILWFSDEASGSIRAFERPGFRQMIQFLDANPHVRDVIVFELSRLGRDYDDLKDVLHLMSNRGIRLWIVTLPAWNEIMENVRSVDNPLVKLLYKLLADVFISVMSFAATQERLLISLRTKAGIERARTEGKRLGRPPYPMPIDEVGKLMKTGLPLTKIHKLLVAEGRICRDVGGRRECMKYETFRRKVKKLWGKRRRYAGGKLEQQ